MAAIAVRQVESAGTRSAPRTERPASPTLTDRVCLSIRPDGWCLQTRVAVDPGVASDGDRCEHDAGGESGRETDLLPEQQGRPAEGERRLGDLQAPDPGNPAAG